MQLAPAEQRGVFARGIAWHHKRAGEPYDEGTDPFLIAAVERVNRDYVEPFDIVDVEVPFEIPLVNPDTGGKARSETLGGHIDAIGRIKGTDRLVVVERKTTSGDPADMLKRLELDGQVLTYWLGALASGIKVEGVIYCVQPWPGGRPKKATPVEERKYTEKASKLKDGTIRPAGSLYANQRETDETPEEFAARLEVEPPIFREVPILTSNVTRHQRDLWAQHSTRVFMRRNGFMYRNPQSCEDCPFVPICGYELTKDTVPEGFVRSAPRGAESPQGASPASEGELIP